MLVCLQKLIKLYSWIVECQCMCMCKCMCVKPSVMKDLYVPTFHLGHLNIKAVEKETYLGYIINADMYDDDHISKVIRNI